MPDPTSAPCAVRERPIIFSGPMVRAILAGKKTMTRRIVAPQPMEMAPARDVHPPKHPAPYLDSYCGRRKTEANPRGMGDRWCWWTRDDRQGPEWIRCPFGVPGDRLWVRETWAYAQMDGEDPVLCYRADARPASHGAEELPDGTLFFGPWRPPIFMRRASSRITLEVTEIRVERLHAIAEDDAVAEGMLVEYLPPDPDNFHPPGSYGYVTGLVPFPQGRIHPTARGAFADGWDSINGKRAPWASNPWVWVVTFRRS